MLKRYPLTWCSRALISNQNVKLYATIFDFPIIKVESTTVEWMNGSGHSFLDKIHQSLVELSTSNIVITFGLIVIYWNGSAALQPIC